MQLSSDQLFHYARDTTKTGTTPSQSSAIDNLVKILVQSRIKASNPHSMFPETLKTIYHSKFNPFKEHDLGYLDALTCTEFEQLFNVVSFTEIPFELHHKLFERSASRRFQVEPFGLSFRKQDVMLSGNYLCNPCLYIYEPRGSSPEQLRKLVLDRLEKDYDKLAPRKSELHQNNPENQTTSLNRLLFSLFSLVRTEARPSKPRHDFAWEREWRNLGDFVFQIETVENVIIEKNSIREFEDKISRSISNLIPEGDTDEGWIEEILKKVMPFPC